MEIQMENVSQKDKILFILKRKLVTGEVLHSQDVIDVANALESVEDIFHTLAEQFTEKLKAEPVEPITELSEPTTDMVLITPENYMSLWLKLGDEITAKHFTGRRATISKLDLANSGYPFKITSPFKNTGDGIPHGGGWCPINKCKYYLLKK